MTKRTAICVTNGLDVSVTLRLILGIASLRLQRHAVSNTYQTADEKVRRPRDSGFGGSLESSDVTMNAKHAVFFFRLVYIAIHDR